MDVEIDKLTVEPHAPLSGFCRAVIAEHASQWPPQEHLIAEQFIAFFDVPVFLGFEYLVQFAARLGIALSEEKLPSPLRGHNHHYEGTREIRVNVPENPMAETFGIREHTFFHELREQLEYEFRELGKPVATVADLEERAEEFAAHVRARAVMKGLTPAFEKASEIQSGFWRGAAFVGAFLLLTALGLGCIILPKIEDRLPKP